MTSYLNQALTRVAGMLEEAVPGSKAVPYFYYAQSQFPYFTMRVAAYAPHIDSEQLEYRPYVLIIRYVMAHLTDPPNGSAEQLMYENLPVIESFFAQRLGLQDTAHPEPLDEPGGNWALDTTGTYITLSQGLTEFPSVPGIPAQIQIGSEFHLHLSFSIDVDQIY